MFDRRRLYPHLSSRQFLGLGDTGTAVLNQSYLPQSPEQQQAQEAKAAYDKVLEEKARTYDSANSCMDAARDQDERDACGKVAWETMLAGGCAAAVTSISSPELAPLCAPLSLFVGEVTVEMAKLLSAGLAAVIPSGWTAHGINSPNLVPVFMWQGPGMENCFDPSCMGGGYPILTQWRKAVATVQAAWNSGRAAQKLKPASFSVRHALIIPQNQEDRVSNDPSSWAGSSTSAEDALLFWLHSHRYGWQTQAVCNKSYQDMNPMMPNSGIAARVWNSELPGTVQDGPVAATNPGDDPNVWMGKGPFGIKTNGWPSDMTPQQAAALASCVTDLWNYRLALLQQAVPEVTAGVLAEIAMQTMHPFVAKLNTSLFQRPSTSVVAGAITAPKPATPTPKKVASAAEIAEYKQEKASKDAAARTHKYLLYGGAAAAGLVALWGLSAVLRKR